MIYMCIYRCVFLLAGAKCLCMYMRVHFYFSSRAVFYPLCFSSQSSVSLSLLHSTALPLSSPLTCVGNVITFGGCSEGKRGIMVGGKEVGVKRDFEGERGEEEENGICMCTQLPLQPAQSHLRRERTHTLSK